MTNTVLTVEKVIYGGNGLVRITDEHGLPEKTGAVVFVPNAVPGDSVEADINFLKRPFVAQITNIVSPSAERVVPKCESFGTCGGCDWQYMSPEAQREWKSNIVQESLRRMAKLPNVETLPILHANEWSYRHKVQWHIADDGELAYLAEESHTGVSFEECLLIAPVLSQLATILKEDSYKDVLADLSVHKITAKTNQAGEILIVFHSEKEFSDEEIKPLLKDCEEQGIAVAGIVCAWGEQWHCMYGEPDFLETLEENTYQVHWQSFFQVNPPAAALMLNTAKQWLENVSDKASLLDLYGGVGTFAIGLAKQFEQVAIVESAPSAIADAKVNISKARLENALLFEGQIEQLLNTLSKEFPEKTSVTLLDPPRKGCHSRVLEWVAKNTKEAILYVSCDPTTLARDIKELSQLGWDVQTVQPVDMFPQTYHIETMVLLKPAEIQL